MYTQRPIHTLKYLNCFLALTTLLFGSTVVSGQQVKPAAGRDAREVSITQTFEPSFQIEPLMHRLEGRSGDIVGFSFSITSRNRTTTLEVSPVGLRQELTGQILNDSNIVEADYIKFLTPERIVLEPNVASIIEGVVKIPAGNAKFHSLGVMVRDLGSEASLEKETKPDGSLKTQAGVRFMTQYVLRLDLVVTGARGESGQEMAIESIAMQSFEGRPLLQAIVSNPADSMFEFELRTRLRASPSDRSFKPLRLVMPVRTTIQDEGRYVGRVLPKSRVRMEELLPEAIASGKYEADVELLVDGRVIKKKTLTLDVDAENFPAQQVLITQAADGLLVSPAQIELSQLRGGARRLTMLFKNNSTSTKTISVSARGSNELELPSVMIQPSEFQLAPAASRKIALTLKGDANATRATEYGVIAIGSKSDGKDFFETQALPLAIMLKQPGTTQISMSPVVWDPNGKHPVFRTTIANEGESHLPVESRLTILSSAGNRLTIPGGFGRWLMPSSNWPLEFRMDQALPPGDYQLTCEIQTGGEPLSTVQTFTVSDFENDATEIPVSTSRN